MLSAFTTHSHVYAPDKPAFLARSGRAMLFLCPPSCPGQMNDEKSERHLSVSDKSYSTVEPLSQFAGKHWAAANDKLKVGARYTMDGPAFTVSLSRWVILKWGGQ